MISLLIAVERIYAKVICRFAQDFDVLLQKFFLLVQGGMHLTSRWKACNCFFI